jgi:hypothetical protein
MLPSVVLVMTLVAFAGLSDGLRVQKVNSTEVEKPRTVEKPLSLLLNLFKVYRALKPKTSPGILKNVAKVQPEIVPFDGLPFHEYFKRKVDSDIEHFPTMADLIRQEQKYNLEGTTAKVEKPKVEDEKMKEEEDDTTRYPMLKKFLKDKNVLLGIKVLLKVIIFHSIIKFIGLISLLFFLPTLNYHEGDADKDSSEETRSFDPYGESHDQEVE